MAKGFIQKEEKIQSENKFANFEFEKKGDSINFFFMDIADRTSPQYGDFEVLLGLKIDDLSSIEAALQSAKLVSLIPHTIIKNRVTDGTVVKEELYSITRAWDRGEKFADGKVAKSYGYDIKHLVIGEEDRQKLIRRYRELLSGEGGMVKSTSTVAGEPDM